MLTKIAPHPPFVFDEQGREIYPEWSFMLNNGNHYKGGRDHYIEAFGNQTLYLNQKIEQLAYELMRNTKGNTVIIIHSDHGPGGP